jgi:very-short-patch-repair endonuclease
MLPGVDGTLLQTVTWRSSLACVSAAQETGLWVWKAPSGVHLSSATTFACPEGVVIHRTKARHGYAVPDLVMLRQVMRCLPEPEALVIVESAVVKKRVTVEALRDACRGRGSDVARRIVRKVDPRAQSPAETLARDALLRAGYRVRSQVPVPGVGHVDLEVDGVLLVEIDGRTYHSDVRDFEEDRRRGNAVSLKRRFVVRIPARWVLEDPQSVVREVEAWFRGKRS